MSDRTNPKDLLGIKKPPLHLVPTALLLWVSKIFQFSAVKYGPFNWREHPVRKSIYLDAIERHLVALKDGEWLDPESKRPHAAHIGANVAILLDAQATGNLIDDMTWKPGPGPQILKELDESKKIEPLAVKFPAGELRAHPRPTAAQAAAMDKAISDILLKQEPVTVGGQGTEHLGPGEPLQRWDHPVPELVEEPGDDRGNRKDPDAIAKENDGRITASEIHARRALRGPGGI